MRSKHVIDILSRSAGHSAKSHRKYEYEKKMSSANRQMERLAVEALGDLITAEYNLVMFLELEGL